MAYITVQDVRDAGITEAVVAEDDDITAAIELCQQFLERATRQWFESRTITAVLDGTDSDALHLPVPVLTVTSLKINASTAALDSDLYRVYSGRSFPDDRKNPRIKLVGPDSHRDIYTAPLVSGRLRFRKGRQNQEVVGTFGYLEADDTTPLLIARATLKLVIEKLTKPAYVAPDAAPPAPPPTPGGGVVMEEKTDGHSIKYAVPALAEQRGGLIGFTRDQEVLDIIKLYRAPIGIAAPAHWSYA